MAQRFFQGYKSRRELTWEDRSMKSSTRQAEIHNVSFVSSSRDEPGSLVSKTWQEHYITRRLYGESTDLICDFYA